MKTKVIQNRRKKSAKYFENGETSKYGKKIALQKKGIFNENSPFICTEFRTGLTLNEFNKIRFRKIS